MRAIFNFIKRNSVWIFIIYLFVLVFVLIFKFPSPIFYKLIDHWKNGGEIFWEKPHLVPFEIITKYVKNAHSIHDWFFKNLACNIIMFMPFGFLLPLFAKRNKWWHILITGIIASVIIEVIQGLLGIGISDIDDVILNTFGLILGFLIYKLIYCYFMKRGEGHGNKQN